MSSQILNGDPSPTQEEYRERLIAEATEARKHLDPFPDPVERSVITAFLLYGCHIGLGNQRHAYYFLREATTLYTAERQAITSISVHATSNIFSIWKS